MYIVLHQGIQETCTEKAGTVYVSLPKGRNRRGEGERMLYCEEEPLRILGTTCGACCGCHQPVVRCCCNLLLRNYSWVVVALVRLGCWIKLLACDSERIGWCGKYKYKKPFLSLYLHKTKFGIQRNLTTKP